MVKEAEAGYVSSEARGDPNSNFNNPCVFVNNNPCINLYRTEQKGKAVKKIKTVEQKENKTQKSIKILFSNIRGWKSKSLSLSNIANEKKLDLIVLNETHCTGSSLPKIKGYTSYGRNRTARSKGGIAILVFDSISKFATKLESSSEPAEFFAIRLDCFSPSLVVMTTYGIIEGQYTQSEMLSIQSQFFSSYESYVNEGSDVLVLGDFNNHIGNNLGLTHNNKKVSPGGKNVSKWVEENGLSLVNVIDQTHTHIDRSSKNNDTNILDLAITNNLSSIESFTVDKQFEWTPYRVGHVKKGIKKSYTDHLSLCLQVKVEWCKKPTTNKVTGWNFSKEGGNDRYKECTDALSTEFGDKVHTSDNMDEVYDWLMCRLEKVKREAYGKTTSTIKRAKKIADNMMWNKRVEEVTKCIKEVGNKRINMQVWDVRKRISDKYADKQFVSIKDPVTGHLTTDRASTFSTALEYNYNLLRKDKIVKTEAMEREDVIKDIIIKSGMSAKELKDDAELSWDDFKGVLLKVELGNKSVYRDVVKAGWLFKRAYFDFLNKIYVTEKIPVKFQSTELMQLFKNKGSRNELKNNRFIHLKQHGPKILERMIMTKLERRMSAATPDFQIGGQKLSSTTEHLVTLISYMRHLEKTQGGGITQFLDIKACFDVIELRDILKETSRSGVVGKPLRNIAQFTDQVKINIQGDESGNTKTVFNSAGQGSGYAPVGTSLTMATVIEDQIKEKSIETGKETINSVKNIKLSPLMYVDDIAKTCKTPIESKEMGEVITSSLGYLRMEAHPDKSGLLVFGRSREKLKEEILKNPTKVQDFEMGFKTSETYLGMQFAEKGASESITETLLTRRIKCMTKSVELAKNLEDDRIQAVGWLVSAVNVFNAVIVSTLLYGCGSWTNMTKTQEDLVEAIQRQCLVTVLGITPKCSYRSLLYVTGIMPAVDVIKKIKVTFLNDLFHVKASGICKEVLEKEYELDMVKGLVKEVKEICGVVELDDVSTSYVRPRLIKERIEGWSRCMTLTESLASKSAPYHHLRTEKRQREYFTYSKEKAKLALSYDVGCLNLRGSRRAESMSKYGSLSCLIPGCTGMDTLDHILYSCQGYSVDLKDNGVAEEFIETLYSINQQRWTRFGTSMVNWKS